MPENATIANGVQIGVESTSGTGVAANKLLKYLSFDLDPEINFNRFRAMGAKYASAITPGQDLTTFGLSGAGSYSEIVYALNSNLVTGVITTTDRTAKVHTFTPAIRTEDAVKTYTIEQGGSVRAGKCTYGIVSDLELSVQQDGWGDGRRWRVRPAVPGQHCPDRQPHRHRGGADPANAH